MRRTPRCTIAAALLLAAGTASAQTGAPLPAPAPDSILAKCDPHLKLELARMIEARASAMMSAGAETRTVSIFAVGSGSRLAQVVAGAGGRIGARVGDIATVELRLDRVIELASSGDIRRLELGRPVQLHNDTAMAATGAIRVKRGDSPLEHALTGKGVIVGVIDTGLDIHHREFLDRNDETKTRIRSIWSLVDPVGPAPDGFEDGTEWTHDQIAAELGDSPAEVVRDMDTYGHGTHVSATAAGIGGVASDAEIVMVHFNNNFEQLNTDVLNGAAYIYREAEKLGRPCVINASLGTIDHPGDGSDALALGIDALVGERPGRIFCASIGNNGQWKIHWGGFEAQTDSLFAVGKGGTYTFRVPDEYRDSFRIAVYVDTVDASGTRKRRAVGVPWRSVAELSSGLGVRDTLFRGGTGTPVLTTMIASGSPIGNGFTSVVLDLKAGPVYKVMVRGKGLFHAWSQAFETGSTASTEKRFRATDANFSVGSPSVGRNVISVGAYVNRSQYLDVDGRKWPTPALVPGRLATFSSRGPSTDGRVKPDVVGPGQNVVSARSKNSMNDSRDRMVGDGTYVVNSGTSMSCPVVTGVCALLLERNPTATVDEIRDALRSTAGTDAFTASAGSLPNGQWGYGKLNAFAALQYVPADVRELPAAPASTLQVIPNPTTGRLVLRLGDGVAYDVTIHDAIGDVVASERGRGDLRLDLTGWPSGVYRCRALVDGVRRDAVFVKVE